MKLIKTFRTVTQGYDVQDGPIIGTDPNRLSKGRFKVEQMTVSWVNGEINRIFVRGQSVRADGQFGKWRHDRNLLPSTLPEELKGLLDKGSELW